MSVERKGLERCFAPVARCVIQCVAVCCSVLKDKEFDDGAQYHVGDVVMCCSVSKCVTEY